MTQFLVPSDKKISREDETQNIYLEEKNKYKPLVPNYRVPTFDLEFDAYHQLNYVLLDQYTQHPQHYLNHLHTCQTRLWLLQVGIYNFCNPEIEGGEWHQRKWFSVMTRRKRTVSCSLIIQYRKDSKGLTLPLVDNNKK